jgi:hypothetical protein
MFLLPALAAVPAALAAQVASVELTPAKISVTAGDSVRFSLTVKDAAGQPVAARAVLWSVGPHDMGSADSTGLVRTFRQGNALVMAVVGGKVGRATIEVGPRPPASVDVSAESPEVLLGGSTVLSAVARAANNVPLSHVPIQFRSTDQQVATVDRAGVVTGVRIGRARIVAETPAGLRGEVEVSVVPNPVKRLAISGTAMARTGDVVRFTVTATDQQDRPVREPPVRWSVGGRGAAVYPDGGFVAEEPGSYLVTASIGAISASTSIAVSRRVHDRKFERVAHRGFGSLQAGEHWAIGDVLYVTTVADRVYTFDIKDPANPIKVDSVMVDARLVNDVSTTEDGKIGVITREGASSRKNGIVFLDLADPLHPKLLSEYTATVSGGVHSAFIDGHYVYLTDGATGSFRVIDFRNPIAPREVARWQPGESDIPGRPTGRAVGRSLHDMQIKDGLAYLAYWNNGLIILDVGAGIKGGSPEQPKLVSQFMYNVADYYPPEMLAGTHSVFRYQNYLFVADEVFPQVFDLNSRDRIRTMGRIHVLDVSEVERPKKVAEYFVPDEGSHNFWADDDVLYIGNFEAGIRAVDISGELRGDLREQGREIGAVWTGSPDGFRPNLPMAWGAQPHKGYVFASDINSGLWVARLTPRQRPVP